MEVKDFSTLWHAGWLFSDKKDTEIILQFDIKNPLTTDPFVLQSYYLFLSAGILKSNLDSKKNQSEIDIDAIEINDCYTLVKELSKITGFKFSIAFL